MKMLLPTRKSNLDRSDILYQMQAGPWMETLGMVSLTLQTVLRMREQYMASQVLPFIRGDSIWTGSTHVPNFLRKKCLSRQNFIKRYSYLQMRLRISYFPSN